MTSPLERLIIAKFQRLHYLSQESCEGSCEASIRTSKSSWDRPSERGRGVYHFVGGGVRLIVEGTLLFRKICFLTDVASAKYDKQNRNDTFVGDWQKQMLEYLIVRILCSKN